MTMKFTPAMRAKGILTTFAAGNYSLAVTRMREVKGHEQEQVMAIVLRSLTKEEIDILRRYAKDLV